MKSPTLVPAGLTRAATLAAEAVAEVPAYRRFLQRNGLDSSDITPDSFALLPTMTKRNYVQVGSLADRMRGGDITRAQAWSASSGSSGTPTFWPRDRRGTDEGIAFHDRIFAEHFESRTNPVLVVNAFAMGQWIGGLYTHESTRGLAERGHRVSIASPGMDVEAVVACLADLGSAYRSVVLAGYPPFVKEVLQAAPAEARARVHLLLAGESITEAWRDSVHDLIDPTSRDHRDCLIYGTADAGVMGFESRITQSVRRLAVLGSPLAEALYGTDASVAPTIVEYDPERRYIEVDDDGYLLFTVDGAAPLIRYRINDKGVTFRGDQLATVLRTNGYGEVADLVPTEAAYLILYGRTDVATTFYSASIYAEPLRPVFDDPAIGAEVSGRFVIRGSDGADSAPRLSIEVELARGRMEPAQGLAEALMMRCRDVLLETNAPYRLVRKSRGVAADPVIEFVAYGTFAAAGVKHAWNRADK